MRRKTLSLLCRRNGSGALVPRLLALTLLQLMLGNIGWAQNITTVVAPGGSVDLQNNTGNHW